MNASPELFVTLPGGVRLCYQTFGDPSDPAVIFVSGNACSMLDWREKLLELCSPAGDKHYLIRYDHRDTGLSTEFPVPSSYTLSDMAGDIEGLADHLGLSSKGYHLVGASMGGPIAGIVAARRPEQIKSLTLLYTSPGINADLPLSERAYKIIMAVQPMPTGTSKDRKLYIDHALSLYDVLATQKPDEAERKENEAIVAQIVDREMKSGTLYSKEPNHGAASYSGWPGMEMLKNIQCPTTVIQAALDNFFEPIHGETLAKGIEGAEYVLWEDVGHEMPKRVYPRLSDCLLKTWKRGESKWAEK